MNKYNATLKSQVSPEPWRKLLAAVLWVAVLNITFFLILDLTEYTLRIYTLHHYPAEPLPVSNITFPIFYGGRLPHFLLWWLTAVRQFLPQRLLPIPIPPPLYSLLPSYDFIVVGGGTAGSVIAGRLAEFSNTTVLLLEAGGPIIDGILSPELLPLSSLLNQNTARDWKYRTEAQDTACLGLPNRTSYWPRGKMLGGSSVLNFMIYHRGHPSDYDLWAFCLNDTRWNSTSVGKIFKMTEHIHPRKEHTNHYPFPRGIHGPLPVSYKEPLSSYTKAFLAAARKLGYPDVSDYNTGMYSKGGSPLEFNKEMHQGQRVTPYRAYIHNKILLNQNMQKGLLHIIPYAHVTRVTIQKSIRTSKPVAASITGVEFALIPERLYTSNAIELNKRPRQLISSNKEVILSAGAIGTPHILLTSGIGPIKELNNILKHDVYHEDNKTFCLVNKNINDSLFIHLPGVGKHLMDHIFFPAMFAVRDTSTLHNEILSFTNALKWGTLKDYFSSKTPGRGMLSTPGCDAQIIIPEHTNITQKIPEFCHSILNEKTASNSIKKEENSRIIKEIMSKRPDLQILLYGGSPDIWDLREKMNVPIDTPIRFGSARHWSVSPYEIELFRLMNGSHQDRLDILTDVGTRLKIIMLLPVLLHPESSGDIIIKSFNPFVYPLINPRYLSRSRDVHMLLHGVRFIEQLNSTTEWQQVVKSFLAPNCPHTQSAINNKTSTLNDWVMDDMPPDQQSVCRRYQYQSDEFWSYFIRLMTLTLYHPAGTCRMGHASDEMSCTDSSLRLRGVSGLRVADASIFPTLPSGNTQVPVVMVAEMLVTFLERQYYLTTIS